LGWRAFFFALHLGQIVFIGFLLYDYPFVDRTLFNDVTSTKAENAINIAVQLGRLDLASFSIAFFGLILAASVIFAYFSYGHVVEKVAKRETKEIAFEAVTKILRDDPHLWIKVIRENPELIRSVMQNANLANIDEQSDISGDDANAIAVASAEDEND
jgi:hypothetical protein